MLTGVLTAGQLMPLDLQPTTTIEQAAIAGFTDVLVYCADLQGRGMRSVMATLRSTNGSPGTPC